MGYSYSRQLTLTSNEEGRVMTSSFSVRILGNGGGWWGGRGDILLCNISEFQGTHAHSLVFFDVEVICYLLELYACGIKF